MGKHLKAEKKPLQKIKTRKNFSMKNGGKNISHCQWKIIKHKI